MGVHRSVPYTCLVCPPPIRSGNQDTDETLLNVTINTHNPIKQPHISGAGVLEPFPPLAIFPSGTMAI